MEHFFELLGIDTNTSSGAWIALGLATLIFSSLMVTLKSILISQLQSLAKKSVSNVDDILIENIKKPVLFLSIYIGAFIALKFVPIPGSDAATLHAGIKTGFVVILIWALERFVDGAIRSDLVMANSAHATKSMISFILRILVWIIGILMVLDSMGISIAPLLASLGVGSLAVALALQDTLSNFFSGLYILADKPFRVGDLVEFEVGVRGEIVKVGWRSTHVKTIENNIIVVPNAKAASAILTNFDMDDAIVSVVVPVGVAYGSDLDKVERVCIETAKKVQDDLPEGVKEYQPIVRFKEFGDSSINLVTIMRAKTMNDKFVVHHKFVIELNKRFLAEKIEIPFPQRVIHQARP